MNISKSLASKNSDDLNKEKAFKKGMGIDYYKRIISVYPSISKSINNTEGHNILLTSRMILINYSVSKTAFMNNGLLFNKTSYICDLKFPGNITPEMLLKDDISDILNVGVIEPIYAFNNPHIEFTDNTNFIDYGLTMVDLNMPHNYGVINFSGHEKEDQYSDFYKEIVNPNFFNPKFYIPGESAYFNGNKEKSGCLVDFIDDKTRIFKDLKNYKKNIKLFKNGIEKKDRIINKRVMLTNELLLDIFSDLIFMPIEDLDMIIDVAGILTLRVKHMTTFIHFNENVNNFYYKRLCNAVTKTVNNFRNKTGGENFYITVSKNEVLFMINVAFKNKNNSVDEISITNPIHKMYSQFALNNEAIINSIESDAEYAKMNYIETVYKENKLIGNAINTINRYNDILDSYKNELLFNHIESKQMLNDLNQKLLGIENDETE